MDSLEYVKNEIVRNRYSYFYYMRSHSCFDLLLPSFIAVFILEKNLGIFVFSSSRYAPHCEDATRWCLYQSIETLSFSFRGRSKRQTWPKRSVSVFEDGHQEFYVQMVAYINTGTNGYKRGHGTNNSSRRTMN